MSLLARSAKSPSRWSSVCGLRLEGVGKVLDRLIQVRADESPAVGFSFKDSENVGDLPFGQDLVNRLKTLLHGESIAVAVLCAVGHINSQVLESSVAGENLHAVFQPMITIERYSENGFE